MYDLIDFYLCFYLEMYICGNGWDLIINFDNDLDFFFIMENLFMIKENYIVLVMFL